MINIFKKIKEWREERQKKKPWCVCIHIKNNTNKKDYVFSCEKDNSFFEEEVGTCFHQFYIDGSLSMEGAIEAAFEKSRRVRKIQKGEAQ